MVADTDTCYILHTKEAQGGGGGRSSCPPPHGSFMKLHRGHSVDVQRQSGNTDSSSSSDAEIKIQKHQYLYLERKSASRL